MDTDVGFWATAGGIALVDLVLSGDNALVIGAAASRLPRGRRLMAIIWGGLGAIVFRLALAIAATELLRIPLLQAIGGVVLLLIAIRLFLPERERDNGTAPTGMFAAIVTILVADATMSLDNVLAVGALANGRIVLLVAGLVFSMLLLFVASAIISRIIDAIPFVLDIAALVLAWTAANLITNDSIVAPKLQLTGDRALYLHIGCVALVLLADIVIRLIVRRRRAKRAASAPAPASPSATIPADADADPSSVETPMD